MNIAATPKAQTPKIVEKVPMKKKLYIAALILFSVIFAVSAFFLIRYYVQINKSQKAYEALADIKEQALQQAIENALVDEDGVKQEPSMVEVTDKNGEPLMVLPEYAPIYERNKDTVGWIRIDGTNIDFPVMQRKEITDYYLYKNFDGEYSNQGAIYVREQCDVFAPSDNLTIYGHRTNAKTMFGALQDYKKKDFWQGHQYIQFDTVSEHHTYQIISVFTIQATEDSGFHYHLFVNAENDAEFEEFVANAKRHSLYDTGVTAVPGDRLITLSTCEGYGSLGRLVVVAKQVQ